MACHANNCPESASEFASGEAEAGSTRVHEVNGQIGTEWEDIDRLIISKSSGYPTEAELLS